MQIQAILQKYLRIPDYLNAMRLKQHQDTNIPVIPFPFGTYITIHDNLTFEVPH